ncbi:hypothetical protein E3Q22_02457 [Wallemia mellicola]|uniref:Mitogen-activated protein kinase n=1 Tax=Wallemia mellicola TaxID=1708541 RepID=A0A4V4MR78_9BASI|nr:hypothetical protein E3Q22_02457 [Wallemia mellicola]TIB84215.1 hypothetical protein E3Q21_02490 [Wallemia mellicola]TIB87293.1 hypothetical protein E3Q20_02483 [Wallemia mellicola]TIB92244.1 hypothetical protein E3Q19_02028 [Wallemia mellicola]TIB98172.1 hypothetical protein E3Q18_02178 [Wallemia mellicola]
MPTKKLFDVIRTEETTFRRGILFLAISSSISLVIPASIGSLIDLFSGAKPDAFYGFSLPVVTSGLGLLFAVGAAANAGRAMLFRLAGQRIVNRLRVRAYSNSLKQDLEFADKGSGDTLSRLTSDSTILTDCVTQSLSDGLRASVFSVFGLGAMFFISSKLTTVMLAIVPPIAIGAVFYGRYLKRLSTASQDALADASNLASERLNAFRTVTAFNRQDDESRRFEKKIARVLELGRKEAVASGVFFGSTGFSGNMSVLALLAYGGHLVGLGSSLSSLTSFYSSMMRGLGAGERVFALIEQKPQIKLGQGFDMPSVVGNKASGTIRFENCAFSYPTRPDATILRNVSFEVPQGQSVAIAGPSGAGKSSIIGLVMRFYDPSSGRVTFNGHGVVEQRPVLFAGTIEENIKYGMPNATSHEVYEAAMQANCEFIKSLPRGFHTVVSSTALSGGQIQRIAIARALLKKPTLLILDEASSALDAKSESQVNEAIRRILDQSQTTVIVIAHRLSSLKSAHKIVVLEDGIIIKMSQLQPRKHFQAFGTTYAVQEGYSLHKELGQGAYGCVVAGKHEASVAIKKLRGVLCEIFFLLSYILTQQQTILTKRALREIKWITCLYDMDIVDYSNFNEVYLYEELMEADLHAIIRSGQPLTDQHYQSFVYQTLCGLKYIHSADVIHRDLKPGNLLVNADCELKICDFGLARGFESDPLRAGLAGSAGFMTEYVATRWYRAPEIMLSFANYSTSIDIWSVGCILAELLGGRPIFKGRDYVDQLNQILHVLGTPSEETLRRVGSPRAVEYIRSLPIKPRIPFERIYPKANPLALDLLSKMLTFDPAKRITCDEALKHPYLAVWHDPTDEPSCPERFDFGFEVEDSLEGMKSAIVEEVKSFRKKVRTPVNVQQQQQAEQQRLMEEQAAAHIQAKEAKESLPVPSREELSGNETPKDELTSSYTIPPQANANDGSYVLDDPSEELERELASTKI